MDFEWQLNYEFKNQCAWLTLVGVWTNVPVKNIFEKNNKLLYHDYDITICLPDVSLSIYEFGQNGTEVCLPVDKFEQNGADVCLHVDKFEHNGADVCLPVDKFEQNGADVCLHVGKLDNNGADVCLHVEKPE